jgi:hypothetical protein
MPNSVKDPFPNEDVVWGESTLVPLLPVGLPIREGIAYTIDPAYAAEVRDYLGELQKVPNRCLSYRMNPIDYREKV